MIFDLYSKRKKKERGEFPDVYQYEDLPQNFRNQVFLMFKEVFEDNGRNQSGAIKNIIKTINEILRKEYGIFRLTNNYTHEGLYEFGNFFLITNNHENALDVIELVFKFIDIVIRENPQEYFAIEFKRNNSYTPHQKYCPVDIDDLIEELNGRFKEAGIGYQYESGQIIRVDSQFIHSEAVKPVLKLLNELQYKSVNQEFLSAHEHYRHGKFEESMTDCLKSLESLLKTICTNNNWEFTTKDNACRLISIILDNNLIPRFMDNQLNAMRTLLESVSTNRNKLAAHGQGTEQRVVPEYIASYTLHLTASTLLLLAKAEQALNKGT